MWIRETVRVYETKVSMMHAHGALKRFGWKIKSYGEKEGLFEIRAYKGWDWVHTVVEAWRAAKAAIVAEREAAKKEVA